MLINMGPQHPSTHGVLRLVLRTDGEIVSQVEPHIGYLHRCAEKIGENLTPRQWIPYTDRMDYLAAMNMNLGWSLCVEKLLNHELSEKAKHLRVIICELGRIASHLLGMGAYGLDLGTFSPFLYAFREREKILDLFEEVCGARLTYSYLTVGGATHDLPTSIPIPPGLAQLTGRDPHSTVGWTEAVTMFLDWLEPRILEYHALLTRNHIFIKRTAGLGVLSREDAISFGCAGPVLRGSEVDWDLRRDGGVGLVHDQLDWKVWTHPDGDSFARYWVRLQEVREACDMVEQLLDGIPSGPVMAKVPRIIKVPAGEAYVETENPLGVMGYYVVSKGDLTPYRVKIRSASFNNISITPWLLKGVYVPDIVTILGSLYFILGDIDR